MRLYPKFSKNFRPYLRRAEIQDVGEPEHQLDRPFVLREAGNG